MAGWKPKRLVGVYLCMRKKFTVLFVEDDAGVRETLSDVLPDEEFDSRIASSGIEAMQILRRDQIDVLFTDIVMAGLNGIALAELAKLIRPNLRVMFMTGYLSRAEEAEKIAPLFYKPVRVHEIETAIRKSLNAPARLN